jgi:molybdopterin-guanine dinucleotide biosynthesis protein A
MGSDKASLAVGGTTLARRTAGLLATVCDPAVELGPGRSGLPSHADTGRGPLAALAGAGALWAGLPAGCHVLVVATDLPRLTAGLLAWLAAHPSPGPVVPSDGGRPQPLCARYPVAALARLAAAPPASARLTAWIDGLDALVVAEDGWAAAAGDPLALRDADTPGDLAALGGRAQG